MLRYIIPIAVLLAGCQSDGSSSRYDRTLSPEELVCQSIGILAGTSDIDTCVELAYATESIAGVVEKERRHKRHKKKQHHHQAGVTPSPEPDNAAVSDITATQICDQAARASIIFPIQQQIYSNAVGGFDKTVTLKYRVSNDFTGSSSTSREMTAVCKLQGRNITGLHSS